MGGRGLWGTKGMKGEGDSFRDGVGGDRDGLLVELRDTFE